MDDVKSSSNDLKPSWLALNEYSAKYRVSISTLRRRIKAGQIHVHSEQGKYFLNDQAIEEILKDPPPAPPPPISKDLPASAASTLVKPPLPSSALAKNPLPPVESPPLAEPPSPALNSPDFSSNGALDSQKTLSGQFLEAQKELCRQLDQKDQKISRLQEQLADFQTWAALLEKENKELKLLSQKEQALEDWLEKPSSPPSRPLSTQRG